MKRTKGIAKNDYEIIHKEIHAIFDEYSQRGIGYYRAVDDAPALEKRFLFTEYGANPYENNIHSIPEVLLKNSGDNTIEEP